MAPTGTAKPRPAFRIPFLGKLFALHQERLTVRGRFLLWTMLAFGVLGLDTHRTQVYMLFAPAAAMLLVAVGYALSARPRMRLDCRLPERATARTPVALVLALAALAAWAVRAARRWRKPGARRRAAVDKRTPADGVAPELAELLARVDSAWTRAGYRRPTARAPLEHLSGIASGKISPALREASRRAVECYYCARYAGLPVTAAEIAVVRQALDQARAATSRG